MNTNGNIYCIFLTESFERLHVLKTLLFQTMIALNTIRLWQSKRKQLSHVSAYFWQHATINCHHILKLEKELIQRIRFFFPKDYFSFKMCLSSLWYKIFHNDYYFIIKEKNLCENFQMCYASASEHLIWFTNFNLFTN